MRRRDDFSSGFISIRWRRPPVRSGGVITCVDTTVSSVFSCLAVHGAVLHMDGVVRHKLPTKCFGVFAQTKTGRHPLMQDVPRTFRIPHARWNEVEEGDLANCGYSVLTWSA